MKYFQAITLAALVLFSIAVHAQSSSDLLTQGMVVLDDGANKRDYNLIVEAVEIFERIPEDDSLAIWAHYYAGAASSDVANLLAESGQKGLKKRIAAHINSAVRHLEAVVELNPTNGEGWALLALAYVHKITVRPFRGPSLGRKFDRSMERAIEIDPNNPRIKLMKAIADYELPGIVGGSKKRAERLLKEAILIFADEVVEDPFEPSWGYDQAYARLGIVYMDRGDLENARNAFEQALEINPELGFVILELLPVLEDLEAKKRES